MGTIEVEGENREDALALGLAQLGLSKADVEVETIDTGRRLLGILGRSTVRLRIHYPDPPGPPEVFESPSARQEDRSLAGEAISPGDRISVARETLEKMIGEMGIEALIDAESREGGAYLNIRSREAGLLIGRRGETLDALEYLVDRIVNRPPHEHVRVTVDAEGYRERSAEKLREMASNLADKAKRTGEPVTCKPMNPRDRREIHMALRDVEGIETFSEGEGANRQVVISPTS